MEALLYVVRSILTIALYAFLLRCLLPIVRADPRNPLVQAILALTSWLVMPLRRVLPPIGRFDTASFVALLIVQVGSTLVLFRLATGVLMPIVPLLLTSLITLLISTIWFFIVALILYALMSFIAQGYNPFAALLSSLCEPLLRPLRQVLPTVGGIDFSPLVAIIILRALLYLI